MQQQQRSHAEERDKLLEEVKRLREEKEEQQSLLVQSLVLSEDARVEARIKHELTRLARENLVGRPASGPSSSVTFCSTGEPARALCFFTLS